MTHSLKALTGDDEIDDVLRYLRNCSRQERAARLNPENVDALVALIDHLFAASRAVPTVQTALVELLGTIEADTLVGLLAKIDRRGMLGHLTGAAA